MALTSLITPPGPWTPYTPALTAVTTNPVLGTGATAVGRYTRWGRTVTGTFFIKFGTSGVSAGSGQYKVSLPLPRSALLAGEVLTYYGQGQITDASLNIAYLLTVRSDTDPSQLFLKAINGANNLINVSNVLPFAWAADDVLSANFEYETL